MSGSTGASFASGCPGRSSCAAPWRGRLWTRPTPRPNSTYNNNKQQGGFMRRRNLAGKVMALAAGLLVGATAFADGTVTSVKGSARVGNQPLTENQQIVPGSVITTGPDAQVVLRF